MKLKTAELEGELLDAAVGMADGLAPTIKCNGVPCFMAYQVDSAEGPSDDFAGDRYAPSTRWDHGGPIVQRERIMVGPDDFDCTRWYADKNGWMCHDWVHGDHAQFGPTPLVAAMRCFVASKFGEEVEIP